MSMEVLNEFFSTKVCPLSLFDVADCFVEHPKSQALHQHSKPADRHGEYLASVIFWPLSFVDHNTSCSTGSLLPTKSNLSPRWTFSRRINRNRKTIVKMDQSAQTQAATDDHSTGGTHAQQEQQESELHERQSPGRAVSEAEKLPRYKDQVQPAGKDAIAPTRTVQAVQVDEDPEDPVTQPALMVLQPINNSDSKSTPRTPPRLRCKLIVCGFIVVIVAAVAAVIIAITVTTSSSTTPSTNATATAPPSTLETTPPTTLETTPPSTLETTATMTPTPDPERRQQAIVEYINSVKLSQGTISYPPVSQFRYELESP